MQPEPHSHIDAGPASGPVVKREPPEAVSMGHPLGVLQTTPQKPALERLRNIGLFGGLGDEVLASFVANLTQSQLAPGTVVFREGECGRDLHVILEGEVEVVRRSKRGHETRVAILGPGDWFGEMSVLDVLPRSATTRVLAPANLLRMCAHDLDCLYRKDMRSYALVVLNIAREMSRRLRVADGLLADVVGNVLDEYVRRGA